MHRKTVYLNAFEKETQSILSFQITKCNDINISFTAKNAKCGMQGKNF